MRRTRKYAEIFSKKRGTSTATSTSTRSKSDGRNKIEIMFLEIFEEAQFEGTK